MTKILIVDDNAQNLYLLDVLLKTNGYNVDLASNGVEALEIAKLNPPDLIISDILMPTMDGFSLCRSWKKDDQLNSIPFLFFTATYTDKKDEEFALNLGAERFIIKPKEPEELLQIIREEIQYVERNKRASSPSQIQEEEQYYKGYNEALIRKLENKMIQQEQLNKRLNAFYQVSCDLVTMKSADDLIRSVLNGIVEMAGYDKAIFFNFDEKKNQLSVKDAVGVQEENYEEFIQKLEASLRNGQSFARIVARSREIVNIPSTSQDPRWIRLNENIHSAIFIPVQYDNELLGVLGLYSSENDVFTADEKNLIILANSIAISIINQRNKEEILKINNHLEELVEKRTDQIATSNKDLEAFAYTISHDLRAPLRAIEGYSRILQDEYKAQLSPESGQLLDQVCSNVIKMDTLITDVLSLSRVGIIETKQTLIDITALVNEVYDEISTEDVRKRYKFTVSPLPEVRGDLDLIRQVWQNLLSNAVKFSVFKSNPVIQVKAEVEDGFYIYLVEDNGIGFNQDAAQDLFTPFQRQHHDDRFESTGVGLAIVKRIVERHGGKVWCKAKPDEGAVFSFSLPKDNLEK